MTLTFTQGHYYIVCLKVDKSFNLYFNSNMLENISAMAFNLVMKVDLCMGYMYTHDHFSDLDLDARSQWLNRGTNSALNYLDN